METVTPEIVEESKPIPEQAEVGVTRIPVQELVINGVRRTQYAEAPALVCPKCGFAVKRFQPGTSALSILKSLSSENADDLSSIIYCSHCGQPLRIMRPAPIDADEPDEK